MELRTQKADNIRGVIRYLQKFKNATVVIYLDDKLFDSPLFSSHIKDIALLHASGLKVVIVPGAKKRIDEVLGSANISWSYKDNVRITDDAAIPLIKMAAFDVSNIVMTNLAANKINAVIGNWVTSRAIGVLDGQDFGTAGEISRLDIDAVHKILDDGFIPIFPCIGWNSNGQPYNISSLNLAQNIATSLKADKLFFVMDNKEINSDSYNIPEGFALSEAGDVPAMTLEEVSQFLKANERSLVTRLLELAKNACEKGVTRVHILNGNLDGVLPCEIFSDLGSGTMIYTSDYGGIRQMTTGDVPRVLGLMRPFFENGKLLPRTENQLLEKVDDYIVYEFDGGIRACAALHKYPDGQGEIAAVAVDENFKHMGIGEKMVKYLCQAAKARDVKSVFILTTQAGDWFQSLGFKADSVESLPPERRAKWTPERNSKVFRK
ncbi:MAG: amino-acid N-acetyltransferase [Treponema sp.]|nr:amino-acid N-acetyltransferase [Treponema sp.]